MVLVELALGVLNEDVKTSRNKQTHPLSGISLPKAFGFMDPGPGCACGTV